ncbi:MAG: hypothetical protein ACOYL8_01975 [Patescibacteria group bacterium]
MNYKNIIGILAAVIGFIGYIPYFRDILLKKTKPHLFSWFIWTLISGIAFFAQMNEGAGSGAWVVGLSSIICFSIGVLALFQGERKITTPDWIALSGAIIGLTLWQVTSNPLLAIIFVTIADALAFIPSFRKAYYKPYEETQITWLVSSFKFILALIATESYGLTTVLYPLSLVLTNGGFLVMLLIRRKILSKAQIKEVPGVGKLL